MDFGRPPRITVLLSVFNGAQFLPEQLDSFLRQDEPDWLLLWRDDGSSDGSIGLMRDFAAGPGRGRCSELAAPGRLGAARSFLTLLRAADAAGATAIAYADQDDVWLPSKLSRALGALGDGDTGRPAIYFARQMLTDAALRPIGMSAPVHIAPGFPAALTQNVATGCTVAMNAAAVALVAGVPAPPGTLHDWWSYRVVASAGGRLISDAVPVVLYRQHAGNLVGAPPTMLHRAWAALRRGPGPFMTAFRTHVAGLAACPGLLTPQAARDLSLIEAALHGGALDRLRALRLDGLRRQTWTETALFRLWFLTRN